MTSHSILCLILNTLFTLFGWCWVSGLMHLLDSKLRRTHVPPWIPSPSPTAQHSDIIKLCKNPWIQRARMGVREHICKEAQARSSVNDLGQTNGWGEVALKVSPKGKHGTTTDNLTPSVQKRSSGQNPCGPREDKDVTPLVQTSRKKAGSSRGA